MIQYFQDFYSYIFLMCSQIFRCELLLHFLSVHCGRTHLKNNVFLVCILTEPKYYFFVFVVVGIRKCNDVVCMQHITFFTCITLHYIFVSMGVALWIACAFNTGGCLPLRVARGSSVLTAVKSVRFES